MLQRPDMRDCALGAFRYTLTPALSHGEREKNRSAEAVAPIADQPGVDRLLFHASVNDGNVSSLYVMVGKHSNQFLLRLWRAGKQHQAAGVAIQTMDRANLQSFVAL